jgi:hypothetical protein
MSNDYTICWVHTESCHKCQGRNAHYRTRMGCKNCPLLQETLLRRGLSLKPREKLVKSAPDISEKIILMKMAGATHRDIAAATGLSENTVNGYITKANKAAGATKPHRKRGDV